LLTLFGMDAGHIHTAISNKIQRKPAVIAVLVLGLLCVILPLLLWAISHSSPSHDSASNVPAASSSLPLYWNWNDSSFSPRGALQADRPIYPYSVIPGGAHSSRELREAVQRERVVAAHYAKFAISNARVIRLARDRQVYVSYRLGSQIYWTKKKVTLHKGETFLSDGKHLARTRCGNRISEVPAEPTSPSEPDEKVLDHPLPPRISASTTDSPLPDPIWSDGSPPLLTLPSSPAGTVPVLPFFPPVPCCGSSPRPSPSPSPGPYPPPVVATPEPGSLVLLITGSAVLLLFWKSRRH
jgi:hypothetical protein